MMICLDLKRHTREMYAQGYHMILTTPSSGRYFTGPGPSFWRQCWSQDAIMSCLIYFEAYLIYQGRSSCRLDRVPQRCMIYSSSIKNSVQQEHLAFYIQGACSLGITYQCRSRGGSPGSKKDIVRVATGQFTKSLPGRSSRDQ